MSADHTTISFVKYHGAGNDFICIDDRDLAFATFETQMQIANLCQRHLGIGADGLILLRVDVKGVLLMVYYNADGAPSSFCGNGSRCFIHFAHSLGLVNIDEEITFQAADGSHTGRLLTPVTVMVSMHISAALRTLSSTEDFIDTGSPHFIRWMEVLPEGEIISDAREVRYSPSPFALGLPAFAKTGVNVNFVSVAADDQLRIRTYERGVEDETLACGTGITAAALSFAERRTLVGQVEIHVRALGGDLSVSFQRSKAGGIEKVQLIGPATPVFQAHIRLTNPGQFAS